MLIDVRRTSNSFSFFILDIDNDCLIDNCTWADDKHGVYSTTLIDPNGKIIIAENGCHEKEVRRGNIKILDINCISHIPIIERLKPSLKGLF